MVGKRVVFTGPDKVEAESFDISPPGPGEVLIRAELTLISAGTEGAQLMALPNTPRKFPQCPGYSHVGRILDIGGNVEGLSQGDRVASHGGHASHVVQRAEDVITVPDGLSPEAATFSCLAAVSLQGVRKAQVELGESVLVIGQGIVGNLALQFSRLQGGYPVFAADLDRCRLEISQQVGADEIIHTDGEDFVEATRSLTSGEGAQVVIEATGNHKSVVPALQAAVFRGRVVLLSGGRGEVESVNFYRDVNKRGLTIIGATNAARPAVDPSPGLWPIREDERLAVELIAGGRIQVDPMITHRFAWSDAAEAYGLVTRRQYDAVGILLEWNEDS